ncbi:unnamed protein product [Oppiella nova]|uniref:Uncharacterized protein n=1 Tax=Oppiella nova TaxID=334625 RepID=A0A7R9MDJ6_9ACAR|nr:unnamed protein product [Oppiella nova]CAG2175377.1 unnamed protein product [Oppiella nova]
MLPVSSSLSGAYTTETYGTGTYNYYNSGQTRRWGGTGTPNGYYGATGQPGTGHLLGTQAPSTAGILTIRMALVALVMGVILALTVCTALVGPTQVDTTKELLGVIE